MGEYGTSGPVAPLSVYVGLKSACLIRLILIADGIGVSVTLSLYASSTEEKPELPFVAY